jgi:hypothetical protein
MSDLSIESVDSAINEYYKLKNKYETEINKHKKTISNNKTLSNKEKRMEFQKFKPKCVNCGRPVGTIFSVKYFPEINNEGEHKELKALCGGLGVDPCNLNITIRIGLYNLLPNILNVIEKIIKEDKADIIDDKNKLLFGYITTEQALQNFEEKKDSVNDFTELLQDYLGVYTKITDNKEKNQELKEDIENSYALISNIKECVVKYNETDNNQFIRDLVNIYTNQLKPILNKIAALKYKVNTVHFDEDTGIYHLIQSKYNIKTLEYTNFVDKVIFYNVGFKKTPSAKKPQVKKTTFVIESESEKESEKESENEYESESEKSMSSTPISIGGSYPNEMNNLNISSSAMTTEFMDSLPPKLKFALTFNEEWKKNYMDEYLKAKQIGETCKFIPPPSVTYPPEKNDEDKWMFGDNQYNEVFNKLPEDEKKRVLKMYELKDGIKDYTVMENYMNELVGKSYGLVA